MLNKLLLFVKINKKNFIISTIILLILIFMLSYESDILQSNYLSQYIKEGYGYSTTLISGLDDVQINEVIPFDSNRLITYKSDFNSLNVDLRTIDYMDSPGELYTNNLNKISNGTFVEGYDIIVSPYGKLISNFNIGIDAFGVNSLYVGDYPRTSSEIAIPINLALQVAMSEELDSYKDVIGSNYDFTIEDKEYNATISGVLESDNAVLGSDDLMSPTNITSTGYIYEGDAKSLEEYCTINSCEVQTSKDYNNQMIIIVVSSQLILILVCYILLMKQNYVDAVSFLNNIKWSKTNIIYLLIMPGVVISLAIVLIVSTL